MKRKGMNLMESLTRFGVSMDESLLEEFDEMLKRQGHANRSDAIRFLIRQAVLQDKQNHQADADMAGAIVLVYNHETVQRSGALLSLQHQYHSSIISTMHIHLNQERCLEVLVVRDRMAVLHSLATALRNTRGVYFADLMVSATSNE